MTGFFHTFFVLLYRLLISFSALGGDAKAKKWIKGRKNWKTSLSALFRDNSNPVVWIHVASVGEFEQGLPVLEQLQKRLPTHRFLITFFSPSGYEQKAKYIKNADVMYLPLDTPWNARFFLDAVQPSIALFVKYEFWYNHLAECKKRKIPTLLFSAKFIPQQWFFKPVLRPFARKYLETFFTIGVQDDFSMVLLEDLGIKRVFVAFDTRYDRVMLIKENNVYLPILDHFRQGKKRILVAGSTYAADEAILKKMWDLELLDGMVIVPHDVNPERIDQIANLFEGQHLKATEIGENPELASKTKILILDLYGMLSKAYRFGTLSYVGGGFNRGIHNVLEAAVYGKPVIFGPKHARFVEAERLIEAGGAISIDSAEDFMEWLIDVAEHDDTFMKMGHQASMHIQLHTGGTQRVLLEISKILAIT
jgi:3-deoxy-D-manno-octulosonic-acid transferase